MLATVFLHLLLICTCLVAAIRRSVVVDTKSWLGSDLTAGSLLQRGLHWSSGPFSSRALDHPKAAFIPVKTWSLNDKLGPSSSKWQGHCVFPSQSTFWNNVIYAAGRDLNPPLAPARMGTQAMMLKAPTTGLSQLRDWIKAKKGCIQRVLAAVKRPLSPGSFLSHTCSTTMAKAEHYCRQAISELHSWYVKASNLGLRGMLCFGQDPLMNILRVMGIAYALDWWTGAGQIKLHFDLSPIDVFLKGQYYRLFTSLFLHNGVVHLLQNVRSLWAIGNEAADLLGYSRMIMVYFVSGIIANYISYVYNFVYRNALPAYLFNMTQSAVHGLGRVGVSTSNLVDKVVDRIRGNQAHKSFPLFFLWYANDSLFHMMESALGPFMHVFERQDIHPESPEVKNAVQQYVKRKLHRYRSCGASSAIYGLMGAVCAYHVRFGGKNDKRRIFEIVTSALSQNLMTLFGARVDHVSHLAGFLTGMALTFAF
ncbi:hypothetical protein family protein [Babesia ovis]|uniref:Peptidase S54 rhomboid domain-containing protein n=1 Tax=Babesia ovis TaxID=5869 RepID=A0A9W5T851_BABOV|nr:hypothetical protein family protein [Babesia ovis]